MNVPYAQLHCVPAAIHQEQPIVDLVWPALLLALLAQEHAYALLLITTTDRVIASPATLTVIHAQAQLTLNVLSVPERLTCSQTRRHVQSPVQPGTLQAAMYVRVLKGV